MTKVATHQSCQVFKIWQQLGSQLRAPLSFMALLMIPELKLSDKSLFDGRSFQFTSVTV